MNESQNDVAPASPHRRRRRCNLPTNALLTGGSGGAETVLVDMQIPDTSSVAKITGSESTHLPVVIFIPGVADPGLDEFRANAAEYLLKSIDSERFRVALARVCREASPDHESERLLPKDSRTLFLKRVVVKAGGRTLLLKMSAIDWFESHGNYVRVHAGREKYLVRQTMTTLEEALNPQEFVRIHRTAIVNLDAVKEIVNGSHGEHQVALRDGTAITLSRVYRSRIELIVGKL